MNVVLADVLGYCMGVRRAMDSAHDSLEKNTGKAVYSLGPLIHNQTALDSLEEKGLKVLMESDIDGIEKESVVIVRAHGIPPVTMHRLEARGCTVVNATCPRVLASQKNAAKYAGLGCTVILAGDKNHGEVAGIAGFAGSKFILVENRTDAEKIPDFADDAEAVLLSQTTFSLEEFEQIKAVLSAKIKKLKVFNTICPATRERQEALHRLCPNADGILVVGGKNSANTKRLLQIAEENCRRAALIETSAEIPEDFFKMNTVGITAGASTPDDVIEDVVHELKQKGDRAKTL